MILTNSTCPELVRTFSTNVYNVAKYAAVFQCIYNEHTLIYTLWSKWGERNKNGNFRDYLLVQYWQPTNTAQPSPSKKRHKFRFIFKFCQVLRFNDRLRTTKSAYHFMYAMSCVCDLNKRQYWFAQIKTQMHFHRWKTTSFRLLWIPHGRKCVAKFRTFEVPHCQSFTTQVFLHSQNLFFCFKVC